MASITGSPSDFTTIERKVGGLPMHLRVNAAQCEVAMTGSFPWRVWAITAFQAPGVDGLPMDEERQMIAAAEAELLSVIPDDGATIYAGNITHEGRYVIVLHSQRADALGQTAVSRSSGTHYMWDVYTTDDPECEFLQLKLLPTAEEKRKVKDREVLNALKEAGDNNVIPRPITYYGLFASRENGEAAAAMLQKQGFRPSSPSEMPGKRQNPWSLMFQRTSATEPGVIHKLSFQAEQICKKNGGHYDGWSCEPVGQGVK